MESAPPRQRKEAAPLACAAAVGQLEVEPYAWPDELPDALVNPIWVCLEPDPDDRPRAGEVAELLKLLVAALPRNRS